MTRLCMLSPCLFNLYAEYIMQNVQLNESQAGIKIAGRIGCGEGNPLTLLVEMQIDTDTMETSMDIS